MSNLFDENRKDLLFDDADDYSIDRTDFNTTGNTNLYQQNASEMPGMATSLYSTPEKQQSPDFSFDSSGNKGFQADNTLYPVKTDFSVAENPVRPVQKKAEDNSFRWRESWLGNNLNNANTDNPAHNAAVKALAKTERGDDDPRWFEQAEHLDKMLFEPDYTRLNTVPSADNWGNLNPDNSPSFRAASYGMENLEKDNARIKRVRELEDLLKSAAKQARNRDENATGWAGYQNAYQATAQEGTYSYEQLENIARLYGQPIGKVANQLGLSFVGGVLKSTPARAVNLLGQGANYLSQALGARQVIGDLNHAGDDALLIRDVMGDEEPFFTNPDGTKTAAGEVMKWGNKGAENTFEAGFITLASRLWGTAVVAARAIPVNIASDYLGKHQETMNRLNELDGHALANSPEFMTHFSWNKQLGKNDGEAMNDAKNAIAKRQAALSSGARLTREIIGLKLSEAVPEEAGSLGLDFGKQLSFDIFADVCGQYIQRAMEQGLILHIGDTAM
ncbi:MAG: hypothetical protein GX776_06245 [Oxalobacter sp.]|nr:hypothetical protein [Oxalobacter sp.]